MGNAVTSRRRFLGAAGLAIAAVVPRACAASSPVVDIHQHTNYSRRPDEQLIAHQKTMGVTHTVLLPAGSMFGLEAFCGGNETVVALAHRFPRQFSFFANEVPYLEDAPGTIEKYLKSGAIGIGEQKFKVDCDSRYMERIAELARDHHAPVLMHFQHDVYNTHIERFHRMLEKYPTVSFIGHAQTWWANICASAVQAEMYPKGKVAPGGISDRLLSEYPNMYGDMSAFSGLNALLRDEEHAREFLDRHQDKLLWGSDCDDHEAGTEHCIGTRCLAAIRRLAPSRQIVEKILYGNATRVLKLPE